MKRLAFTEVEQAELRERFREWHGLHTQRKKLEAEVEKLKAEMSVLTNLLAPSMREMDQKMAKVDELYYKLMEISQREMTISQDNVDTFLGLLARVSPEISEAMLALIKESHVAYSYIKEQAKPPKASVGSRVAMASPEEDAAAELVAVFQEVLLGLDPLMHEVDRAIAEADEILATGEREKGMGLLLQRMFGTEPEAIPLAASRTAGMRTKADLNLMEEADALGIPKEVALEVARYASDMRDRSWIQDVVQTHVDSDQLPQVNPEALEQFIAAAVMAEDKLFPEAVSLSRDVHRAMASSRERTSAWDDIQYRGHSIAEYDDGVYYVTDGDEVHRFESLEDARHEIDGMILDKEMGFGKQHSIPVQTASFHSGMVSEGEIVLADLLREALPKWMRILQDQKKKELMQRMREQTPGRPVPTQQQAQPTVTSDQLYEGEKKIVEQAGSFEEAEDLAADWAKKIGVGVDAVLRGIRDLWSQFHPGDQVAPAYAARERMAYTRLPRYSIIVKGDPDVAMQAIKDHGGRNIEVTKQDENETIAHADFEGVIPWVWFGEGPSDAPFPPGTLLHFSDLAEWKRERGIASGLESIPGVEAEFAGRQRKAAMDEDMFWEIIRNAGGDAERLRGILRGNSPDDVEEFSETFSAYQSELFDRMLDVANQGQLNVGGDDSLLDLAAGVISAGKKAYDLVMYNPLNGRNYERAELFSYVPNQVASEKFGN